LSPPPQKVCKLKLARPSYCCRPVSGNLEPVPPDSEQMTVAVTSFRDSGAGTVISAFLKNCRRVASGSLSGPTTACQFGSRPSRRLLLSLLDPHSPDEATNSSALETVFGYDAASYLKPTGVAMVDPTGEAERSALRLDFDRRLMLQFRGSTITSDAGLLVYRELDDTLRLTDTAADALAEARTGKNSRHGLDGLLRQSVFGRLAGYEDVNDAERLCRDPAMRWVVGYRAITGSAASASQMGRFETKWLSRHGNLAALTDLPGQWIDKVHRRRSPKTIVLDMDSNENPTYGEQEGSTYNGHFTCTCYHPLFVFNQFGDVERCALRPGNVHSADGWRSVLEPVVARYRGTVKHLYFRGDAAFANPEVYEFLEAEGAGYTIRLPANRVLQDKIGYLLKRPVGRPPHEVRRFFASFRYQAQSWSKPAMSWPRSNGIRASYTRASGLSSPTWRGLPRVSSPSITSAARASSTSRKARARLNGPGCHVALSRPTPYSFIRWPTISAISCAR
jgi:hypothetical protein